jgi:hypothetical protein
MEVKKVWIDEGSIARRLFKTQMINFKTAYPVIEIEIPNDYY